MKYSESLRSDYIRGAGTKALCDGYAIEPKELAALVRGGGWAKEREMFRWRREQAHEKIKKHLAVTDRLLDMVLNALDDDRALHRHVSATKTGGVTEMTCQELPVMDVDRVEKLAKAVELLLKMQRDTLGIAVFKEEADERADQRKLLNDRETAERKLELELLKLDGVSSSAVPDSLLEAITGVTDDE